MQSYIPLHNRNYLGCSFLTLFLAKRLDASFFGKHRRRSGENTRLPPVWLGFDSRTRGRMWVEFVVGSRPRSEGFSPGSPVLLPPETPTFLNSNSTWNARTPSNEFLELFGSSWVNKLHLPLWNRFRSLWHCESSAVTSSWPSLM